LSGAALVSFGYNCGSGALAKVLAGADTIANPRHTTDAHGVVLGGLVNRRRLEEVLCLLAQ
jgi:GH24 family phage-related lysozyme (muramidase)